MRVEDQSRYVLTLLYTVFVLSGAAGLMYESIWTRYLGLFVGHSAYAQVIVLVMFLGGMSLGALLVGRRSERLRHPLQWYAGVELATGVIGLVFHDVFAATTDFAYTTLFHSIGFGTTQTLLKWGIAALLILPQSILLGMTFPLMSAGVVRRIPEHTGRALSMLYFSNSIGAAAGVLVAGFWLVGFAGLPGTLIAAAMINIAVAGAVFVACRLEGESEQQGAPSAEPAAATSGSRTVLWRLLLLVSFGTALSSFIYEIGWIRMLVLVMGSATHSFELMLSAFILGLALGAFWVRRRADREASVRLLGYVQLAMGALAIATLPVYLLSFKWMVGILGAFTRTPIGYDFFSIFKYGICLAVMLPATFCAGMTLPLITRLLVGAGVGERAIGQVYGVNTFGSIVGAAIAGLVLMPLLGMKWLLVAGASVDLALGVGLLVFDARGAPGALFGGLTRARAVGLAAAAGVVLFALRADFDTTLLTTGVYRYGTIQKPHSRDIVFYKDGRTATVSVRRLPQTGGLSLATNGKPDASLGPEWLDSTRAIVPGPFTHDASTQTLVPLVPLAYAPRARDAAVIGFGSGMTTHVLLGSPNIRSVSTIEIEPEMIRAARHFRPANRRAYDDPRSTIVIDDARSYFAAAGKRFDLILSEPSNPWVSGVSGLFTTEFYRRIRSYLKPDGVFAQWLQVYEIDDGLVLGVLSALSQSFPTYTIYQVGTRDFLVVATVQHKLAEPDWSVVSYPGVAEDLKRAWPLTPNLMGAIRVADQTSLAPLVRTGAVPNSDFYPTLDLNAERTRFLKTEAAGFVGLPAARVNLAAMVDGQRLGFGDSYAVVFGVDRLDAVTVASGLRSGDPRAGHSVVVLRENRRAFEAAMAAGAPPIDWHGWVAIASNLEQGIHGGLAGVADSAFYAELGAYLDRTEAPAAPRAAIDFLHGIDAWNFDEASRAADVLVPLEAQGDRWLDPDQLRDGAVMAKLALGDRSGARRVFLALVRQSARPITDLRTRLLYSYIMDSTLSVGRTP
jgi:predicted membrane-bound spermidine synthase